MKFYIASSYQNVEWKGARHEQKNKTIHHLRFRNAGGFYYLSDFQMKFLPAPLAVRSYSTMSAQELPATA